LAGEAELAGGAGGGAGGGAAATGTATVGGAAASDFAGSVFWLSCFAASDLEASVFWGSDFVPSLEVRGGRAGRSWLAGLAAGISSVLSAEGVLSTAACLSAEASRAGRSAVFS
jgi:hypothetical protein